MAPVPTFETERLVLRAPVQADVPRWQQLFNNWEIIRNLSTRVPWPYPEDGVQEYFTQTVQPTNGKTLWFWAICLKSSGAALNEGTSNKLSKSIEPMIGAVDLFEREGTFTRGFWLGEPYWGKGYMTEAVAAVNDFTFQAKAEGGLGKSSIELGNALGNAKSRRIKEKTGATFIGTEAFDFNDPELRVHEKWELTKETWEAFKLMEAPE